MSQSYGGPRGKFDLGKFIIAKIDRKNHKFEIIADPKAAHKYKKIILEMRQESKEKPIVVDDILHNADIDLNDVFPTFDIFKDVKKGDRVTEAQLEEAFETHEGRIVAAHFLLEGEFAWTQDQRDKWVEKKKKQIITILARNCINPQTKKPHPPKRIEKAMEEARVSIDINQSAEEQVETILKKIALVIPIRMEAVNMVVKVPAQYAAKAYNTVERYAQVKKSEWQTDGSWVGMISLPAGLQMELMDELNKLTHGRIQSKLLQK